MSSCLKRFLWRCGRSIPVVFLVGCLAIIGSVDADENPPKPEAPAEKESTKIVIPKLSAADKLYLIKAARAEMKRVLEIPPGKPLGEPSKALTRHNNPVHVTFRFDRKPQGSEGARAGDLVSSVREAVRLGLKQSLGTVAFDEKNMRRVRFEIDIIGFGKKIDKGSLDKIYDQMGLGIHSLGTFHKGKLALIKGTMAITNDYRWSTFFSRLSKQVGGALGVDKLQFFESLTFVESADRSGVLDLYRGWPLPRIDTLSRESITESIRLGLHALCRQQNKDGSFLYLYYAGSDRERERVNLVRQAGTAWSVGRAARMLKDKKGAAAWEKAIEYLSDNLRYINKDKTRPFIYYSGKGPLGGVALMLLALVDGPDFPKYRDLANNLGGSILTLQEPTGRFKTLFPPGTARNNEDYYPGEALLALMRLYHKTKDEKLIAAVKKSFPYYSKYFDDHAEDSNRMSYCPWQTAAYWELYRVTKDKWYYEYVCRMTDWMLTHQYIGDDLPWPDYEGGFNFRKKRLPGMSGGTYSEGVIDAYRAAKLAGDAGRVEKYRRALQASIPFTMRLQIRLRDTYFMPRPDLSIGNFRANLVSAQCRCDYTQHCITALMKTLLAFDDDELKELERTRKKKIPEGF